MKLNNNLFDFSLFFSSRTQVNSLEEGAKQNGGATTMNDGTVFSNIEKDDFISIKESSNKISLFVPSTIDIDKEIDNTQYVTKCVEKIIHRYSLNDLFIYNTNGSWYSDNMNKVVIEKITILELKLNNLNELDIKYFVNMAQFLKDEMQQEGISLQINESLAII